MSTFVLLADLQKNKPTNHLSVYYKVYRNLSLKALASMSILYIVFFEKAIH